MRAVALLVAAGVVFAACSFDTSGIGPGGEDGGGADDGAPDDADDDDGAVGKSDLDRGDARLVFASEGEVSLDTAQWYASDESWDLEAPTPPLAASVRWTINVVGDSGGEVAGVLAAAPVGSELRIIRRVDGGWDTDWLASSAQLGPETRWFDVAVFGADGVLVVYADGSATPAYRTWQDGAWSIPRYLPVNDVDGPALNAGMVQWIELASRPGSEQAALAYTDDSGALVAIRWDGEQWDVASAHVPETSVDRHSAGKVTMRPYDVAFEAESGDLIVVWGRENSSDPYYAVYNANSGQWGPSTQQNGVVAGQVHFVDLASEPDGDRIAAVFLDLGEGNERLGLGLWSGTTWSEASEHDLARDVNNNAPGDFPAAVAWLGDTDTAVAVYADDQSGRIDWARWREGDGWGVQGDMPVSGKGETESLALVTCDGGRRAVLAISDTDGDLHVATFDGDTWRVGNVGVPLTDTVASTESVPFSLAARPGGEN